VPNAWNIGGSGLMYAGLVVPVILLLMCLTDEQ
jgi:fumarate reductase subunit D